MPKSCIISGSTDNLTDISVDGETYWISEEIADEYSLKKLRELIKEKINEKLAEKDNKRKLFLQKMEEVADSLGISKEEAIAAFGVGPTDKPAKSPQETPEQTATPEQAAVKPKPKSKSDEKFVEVPGNLTSKINASINDESGGSASTMPAYGRVEDEKGQQVVESNKRMRKLDDDTIMTKSDFGESQISIVPQNSHEIGQYLTQVSEEKDLVRGNISGRNAARECTMCRGTGFHPITKKLCPRCKGLGYPIA